MSRFVIDINEPKALETLAPPQQSIPQFGDYQKPKKRSLFLKVLGVFTISFFVVLLAAGIGGYLYWQSVKKTPQYSLALLVDAARRDDSAKIEQLVDTEAVVENFMPQITEKAVELYGRNLPPQTLSRVEQVAVPLMPAVKERAKAELPRLVREKTLPFEKVPYWLIALGADRALEIRQENDTAQVKSKLPERPLELTLKREGAGWKTIAIKDDRLAQTIAEKIGQEIIAAADKRGIDKAGRQFGIENLQNVVRELEGIFK